MRKQVVFACHRNDAEIYANKTGLSQNEWLYLENEKLLPEIRDNEVKFIITKSAYLRPDFIDLFQAAITQTGENSIQFQLV